MKQVVLVLLVGFLMSGCEILGPDDEKDEARTYPQAMNLPAADLQQLLDGIHENGRFNLTAFVVGISECPPDYACLVADNIQVAGSPHTDGPSLMISAEKPSQFDQDEPYVLSIEVFGERFPESSQSRFVLLLAYSDAD